MGHGAWGIGHWALGMGHGAWGQGETLVASSDLSRLVPLSSLSLLPLLPFD
ncbi:hypothetical protein NIES4072_51240 [Nostoc commune NIES-4072]|uniref:Uncharacterized protein n=1 Tax=Nostoc commune NIES-4072 TaxID=2005467 RepID=A0A2R5FRR7_NOSCO|nr:hypothetical protein [Nostoc commune]BBD67578.1 hypothetical protein NIES4070_39710 [Nostoc commune HK-02]GBG21440.1 hypothetical protein NIES4072_51240 [Nostoc commune NIES-4072]